jgi:exopolysaccharide production protein ExoZ
VSEPDHPGRRQVRLTSIEACRGIAATMVMASHCAHTLGAPSNFDVAPFGPLFQFGRAGADLFFVLSGFLISFIHWNDIGRPDRLRHYLARRLTRIYPPYWLVLLLIVPVDMVTRTLYDGYDQPLGVIKNIFLLPQGDPLLDVTWSLRNELLFYSFFGLAIFSRSIGGVVAVVWVALLTIRPFVATDIDTTLSNLVTYPMNFEFVAGVIAGWFIQRRTIQRPGILLGVGLGIFAAFAVAEDLHLLWSNEDHLWYPGPSWNILILRSLGYGLGGVLIIVGLSALEMSKKIRAPTALIMLGDASYLLYLIHVPGLLILGASERYLQLLRFAPPWLLATAYMALIVGGAVILNLTIEKPMLRFIRPRRTPAPIVPVSALS